VTDRLTVRDSALAGNSAALTTNLPKSAGGQLIDMNANSGGIHVGDHIPTTVDHTAFLGNTVRTRGLRGEPVGFDSAMCMCGDSLLTMRDSLIAGNNLSATMATTTDTGPAGDTLELDGGGSITGTKITSNTATVASPHGVAGNAGAGLAVYTFPPAKPRLVTLRGSVISGNTAIAKTSAGAATVQGVGILTNSLLEADGDQISGNTGQAAGPAGVAQGGGIWNGVLISGPPVQLTLDHTRVTRNQVTGSAGVQVRGGGMYTTVPVTLIHSVLAGNRPGQCFGCASQALSRGSAAPAPAGAAARGHGPPAAISSAAARRAGPAARHRSG
jgi:hypothetical protein